MNVTQADRHRLEAIVSDRSAPQKHVWRANIILATAEGCGTAEIMRRSGRSKLLASQATWRPAPNMLSSFSGNNAPYGTEIFGNFGAKKVDTPISSSHT